MLPFFIAMTTSHPHAGSGTTDVLTSGSGVDVGSHTSNLIIAGGVVIVTMLAGVVALLLPLVMRNEMGLKGVL
ncbi:hypothetical protein HanRHA438_Chr07g0305401 [Helianthus annuus]|nr:hypothetical protein HanRHA438_Chr07g0305401 [Helianthus annuus]